MRAVESPSVLIIGIVTGLLTLSQGFAQTAAVSPAQLEPPAIRLTARVVAVGLPGVAGVRQVGRFHHGGPIPSNPEFLLQTDAGRILDPRRLLVAVASNFGALKGKAEYAAGAVLSIDPNLEQPLVVPPLFAAAGGQTSTASGALQLYSAQSLPFLNQRYNAGARSAAHAAAAGPRYLSINNAFGRPWIANSPAGSGGAGSVSVVDPDGAPLANAPSDDAGGVFTGNLTNRRQVAKAHASTLLAKARNYRASDQLTAGALTQGALGTAFLGPSPDGSGLAVFAVVTADGAITQVHVQDGVDGLAAAGSVRRVGDDEGGVIGMVFKWNPDRTLYVADAGRDRILTLNLADDQRHFKVATSGAFTSPHLRHPVDIAAAVPEVANPRFASHTTLAGGSDLYVANRGDGSLLRLDQQGHVLARGVIEIPGLGVLGANQLRALAVSADAQRLWITLQGEVPGFTGLEGVLIEVSAFDGAGIFGPERRQTASAAPVSDGSLAAAGERAFRQVFTPETGLGPLFNAHSCVECHPGPGGISTREEHYARRVARMDEASGRVVRIAHHNSPLARRFSIRELGVTEAPEAILPRLANVVSLRMPLSLFASGAIDNVSDAAIEAQAVSKGDGIKGRVHYVRSADGKQRVGRFGWKADIATLDTMVADAFANELGINSALMLPIQQPIEDDWRLVRAVAAFLRALKLPPKQVQ
jgi:Di-haem oxidoreductase, putative peroxidase